MADLPPPFSTLAAVLMRAVQLSDLNATLKLVAMTVVSHAGSLERNREAPDRVWPGIERVCWLTGLSKSCVKQALRKLVDLRILVPVEWDNGSGSKIGYDIHLENLPERPPFRPGAVFAAAGKRDGRLNLEAGRGHDVTPFEAGRGHDVTPSLLTSDPKRGHVVIEKGSRGDEKGSRGDRIEDLLKVRTEVDHRRVAPEEHRRSAAEYVLTQTNQDGDDVDRQTPRPSPEPTPEGAAMADHQTDPDPTTRPSQEEEDEEERLRKARFEKLKERIREIRATPGPARPDRRRRPA